MGIAGYRKLWDGLSDFWVAMSPDHQVDHLYFDLNAFFYDAFRVSKTMKTAMHHVMARLHSIIDRLNPSTSVTLALDGPSCKAKLQLQRDRRRKKRSSSSQHAPSLSTTGLTPGTFCIDQINQVLVTFAHQVVLRRTKSHQSFTVFLSDSNAPGEGEHKVVRHLTLATQIWPNRTKHFLIGADSDLFVIAQSACVPPNHLVHVLDTTTGVGNSKGFRMLPPGNFDNYIVRSYKKATTEVPALLDDLLITSLKRDFALLSVLGGNDYLPSLFSTAKLHTVFDSYCKLRRLVTVEEGILVYRQDTSTGKYRCAFNMGFFMIFVGACGQLNCYSDLKNLESLKKAWAQKLNSVVSLDTLILVMSLANQQKNGISTDSAGERLVSESARQSLESLDSSLLAHTKYLEGLLFVMQTYMNGECADYYFGLTNSENSRVSADQFLRCWGALCILPLNRCVTRDPVSQELLPEIDVQQHMKLGQVHGLQYAHVSALNPPLALTCGVAMMPVEKLEEHFGPKVAGVYGRNDHPITGPVATLERCGECAKLRAVAAGFQQQYASNLQYFKDTEDEVYQQYCQKLKPHLQKAEQELANHKRARHRDIDLVNLHKLDEDVRRNFGGNGGIGELVVDFENEGRLIDFWEKKMKNEVDLKVGEVPAPPKMFPHMQTSWHPKLASVGLEGYLTLTEGMREKIDSAVRKVGLGLLPGLEEIPSPDFGVSEGGFWMVEGDFGVFYDGFPKPKLVTLEAKKIEEKKRVAAVLKAVLKPEISVQEWWRREEERLSREEESFLAVQSSIIATPQFN